MMKDRTTGLIVNCYIMAVVYHDSWAVNMGNVASAHIIHGCFLQIP